MSSGNGIVKKKDILCAVDFSPSSMDALKWAIEMAKKNQSSLTIMYCFRLIAAMDDEDTIQLKRTKEEEATRKFREFEAKHLKNQPITYRFIMEIGFYHFRIEMYLKQHPVGMVVMANTIVQNFDEYKALGFENFIRQTQVPVVIVPHEHEESNQAETILT